MPAMGMLLTRFVRCPATPDKRETSISFVRPHGGGSGESFSQRGPCTIRRPVDIETEVEGFRVPYLQQTRHEGTVPERGYEFAT